MKFQCVSCGAALDSTSGMVKCPYCRSMNQVAPIVLAESLRIETITEVFSTGLDNQNSVSVHIVQGEADHISQNRNVGNFTFDGIPPAPRAQPRIQFTFEVGSDGRLIVTALNLETQKEQTFPAMQLEMIQR